MDAVAIIVMLLVVMALTGVVIYFIYDYTRFKDTTKLSINQTDQRVDSEKKDRIANVNTVVGEVNKVHTDMYDTVQTSNMMINSGLKYLDHKQNKLQKGFDKAFKFSTPTTLYTPSGSLINTTKTLSLSQLPGYATPDLNLITKVNATMGLTASDLDKSGNKVLMCAKSNPSKCIRIPDENGNTILRNLDDNGDLVLVNDSKGRRIRLDGNVTLNNALNFTPSSQSGSVINNGSLSDLMIYSGKVGIGSTSFSAPEATLHIKGTNLVNPLLKVDTVDGKKIIDVRKDGLVTINSDVQINGRLTDSVLINSPNIVELNNQITNLKQQNDNLTNQLNNTQKDIKKNIDIVNSELNKTKQALTDSINQIANQLQADTRTINNQLNTLKSTQLSYPTSTTTGTNVFNAPPSIYSPTPVPSSISPTSIPKSVTSSSVLPVSTTAPTQVSTAPPGYQQLNNIDCYNQAASIGDAGPNANTALNICTSRADCKGVVTRSGSYMLVRDTSLRIPTPNITCYTKN